MIHFTRLRAIPNLAWVIGGAVLASAASPHRAIASSEGTASSSPFVDQLKSELQEDRPEAESTADGTFLERERSRLRESSAEEGSDAGGNTYLERLKAGLESEEEESRGGSWLEGERRRLQEQESADGRSAIEAVKSGKSDLKAKRDERIRFSSGFHVAANTSRSIESTSAGGSGQSFGSIYTQEMFPPLGFHFDYQPLRWNGVFSLGAGFSFDVSSHRGAGVFKVPLAGFDDHSEIVFRFLTVGTALNAVFRLDLIPGLQPWVAAGPAVLAYREYRNDGGTAYQGYALGTRLAGGLNIRLDALMDSSSWDTVQGLGLNHIYLTAMFSRLRASSAILSSTQDSIFGGFTYEY